MQLALTGALAVPPLGIYATETDWVAGDTYAGRRVLVERGIVNENVTGTDCGAEPAAGSAETDDEAPPPPHPASNDALASAASNDEIERGMRLMLFLT